MDIERIKELIAAGEIDEVESAWLEAVEDDSSTAVAMVAVLELLVKAGQLNTAETCGSMLLADRNEKLPPDEALQLAKAVVSAVPDSDELRDHTAELYRRTSGASQHFDSILRASGLLTGQSPRRALRTIDTCLAISPGAFLANRFDHRVVRAAAYDDVLSEFELTEASGVSIRMDAKNLADEFDVVEESDFRVLCAHRPEELKKLLADDPAAVLTGICLMRGGKVNANELKEQLAPRYITAENWSGWWNRARTAAKKSHKLSVSGRSPIVVSYHAKGRTVEDELAAQAAAASSPLERFNVLQQYTRDARQRKAPVSPAFAGPIIEALAVQARDYPYGPAEALAASLALKKLSQLDLPAPAGEYPSAAQVLRRAVNPAAAIAELSDGSFWPAATDALSVRQDAADQLERLLRLAPAEQLDRIAEKLVSLGRTDAVTAAVGECMSAPVDLLEVWVWLWKGPTCELPDPPAGAELLGRLLVSLHSLEHDWQADAARRKLVFQRTRAALPSGDYAAFRKLMSQISEGVAATLKRHIERCDALAEAVRDEMLKILREHFFSLFIKEKVEPWLDEGAVWTTKQAMDRRQAELKELTDIKMLENARAIGAAAEHGDLSENSEWKFALEERDLLRARAAKMQDELARARILQSHHVRTDRVSVGSRVKLCGVEHAAAAELVFLGPWDSDPDNGIYSYQTRAAQELMGKSVGDVVTLRLDGQEQPYRIESISSVIE